MLGNIVCEGISWLDGHVHRRPFILLVDGHFDTLLGDEIEVFISYNQFIHPPRRTPCGDDGWGIGRRTFGALWD